MGKDEFFRSFRENADNFICSLLPGISGHPQIQYSPGRPTYSLQFLSAMDTFPNMYMRSIDVPCLQVASSSRWATATCST